MPQGRHTALHVTLTTAERRTLARWTYATTIAAGVARRARLVLLVAGGMAVTDVARTVGISRRHVYRWVARFQAQGVVGLFDRPRGGAR